MTRSVRKGRTLREVESCVGNVDNVDGWIGFM